MRRSLRLRLQLWHATLLVVVLIVFGVAMFELQRRSRIQQIDSELHRLAELVAARIRPKLSSGPWRPGQGPRDSERRPDDAPEDRPPRDRPPGPRGGSSGPERFGPPLFQVEVPAEVVRLFDDGSESDVGRPEHPGFYFVVWRNEAVVLQQSSRVPLDTPLPPPRMDRDVVETSTARQRGELREVIHEMRFGLQVLVGRSIAPDRLAERQFGLLLAGIGFSVLAAGIAGGWWLSGRMMQPIEAISRAASAISSANLSQRIDVAETDSELGQLANILNQTFERLQSAFERQVRFTADASHELRTPLSVILLHAEMALSKPRTGEEQLAALDACQRAARRMKSLIESLLTLARFDSGRSGLQRQRILLSDIVAESLDLLLPLAEERCITISQQCAAIHVFGDRDRLAQVVTNLISNAIRYNRDAGQVEVRVTTADGSAIVAVTDTGIGISAADLPHIFDRFFRVDKARSRADGGSGLGLAICQTIALAHGGTITAHSDVDQGTTMKLRLPLSE